MKCSYCLICALFWPSALVAQANEEKQGEVVFSVHNSYVRPLPCQVASFREIYTRGPELAHKFRQCAAKDIAPGTYRYSLGNKLKGELVVAGSQSVKIIEDTVRLVGHAVDMQPPTQVAGVIHGLANREYRRLRLRIVSLWGEFRADSFVGIEGDFCFPAIPMGSYTLILMRDGVVVGSEHFDKGGRPLIDLNLNFAALMEP